MPEMVDSRSLRLFHASRAYQQRVGEALLQGLAAKGYDDLGGGQLAFLGELACGINHAAELARRIGVSRQAVHKQAKELVALGLLQFSTDPVKRNQKVITFTEAGMVLMATCRHLLAEMDQRLTESMDRDDVERMIQVLSGDR